VKATKQVTKKTGKHDRERKVLMGLVEHYLSTGKPVGSNTLKDVGFEDLSSATIRNYFAHLEEEGFLQQQHSSGGRVPTDKAFRLYASECVDILSTSILDKGQFEHLRSSETKEIATFLQQSAEHLAAMTHSAVFLSAPRFDQDFLVAIKLLVIDPSRILCVLITDFGEIRTETLYVNTKLNSFSAKRIEAYFNWRLTGKHKPETMTKEEEEVAHSLYKEILLRFIVNYTQFSSDEVYRTGFSRLLVYPEFQDASVLATSLGLFENTHGMRLLLKECCKLDKLKFWIGDDLATYSPERESNCAVLAIPYRVNKQPVGAIGLLGPVRIPYRPLFKMLHEFADSISEALTSNLYKFKITLRPPKAEMIDLKNQELKLITMSRPLLLEDNSKERSVKRPTPNRRK